MFRACFRSIIVPVVTAAAVVITVFTRIFFSVIGVFVILSFGSVTTRPRKYRTIA
jgi:hypothetical protein